MRRYKELRKDPMSIAQRGKSDDAEKRLEEISVLPFLIIILNPSF